MLNNTDGLQISLRSFEVLATMLAAITSLTTVIIIVRIRLFHWNLTIIAANLLMQFYAHVVVCMYMYYADFLGPDASKETALFLRFFRWTAMTGIAFIMPSMVAERSAACFLIMTYERRPRLHISFCILLMQWSISSYINYLSNYQWPTMERHLYLIGCSNLIAVIIFGIVRRWTARRRKRLNVAEYSLSERFQLAENVRVIRIIRNSIWSAGACTTLIMTLFAASVAIRELAMNAQQAANVEMLAYCAMPICAITLSIAPFYIEERWRAELMTIWRFCGSLLMPPRRASSVTPSSNLSMSSYNASTALKASDGSRMTFAHNEEQQIYFAGLQEMWQ